MSDYCCTCNGRGKYKTLIENSVVEIECEECDGSGLIEEFEAFEKRTRRQARYDDEY